MTQVSDWMLGRLREWGISRVFGYAGDGINGFLGAYDRANGNPEFIQTRHEEMAAFMACAHAKFTGEIGVCTATSGPGAIHLLNGIYDARLDHQPVLAIVGQQKRVSVGAHYQQEIDLQSLFTDSAGFVSTVMEPASARVVLDRAIKSALAERKPAVVIVPSDVQEMEYEDPPMDHGSTFTGVGFGKTHMVPFADDLERAAQVLNEGEKVAILIGAGARTAANEVVQTADLLGAGVAKALLGKDALPDTLPMVTGSIGLLGTEPSHKMVMGCDTLLMIGTSFPYSEWLPPEGQARAVQIDIDGSLIGTRYPTEVNLIGDAKDTLAALLPRLTRKSDRSWREFIEEEVRIYHRVIEDQAKQKGDPINPQLVFFEMNKRLPDNVITTADSGSATNWWARQVEIRDGMRASLSGTLATMVPGVPYAIAAKFAYPERPVVGVVGDGAFQMLGMNELLTVVHYAKELLSQNPTLIFVVLVNEDLNQVSYEQRVMASDPIALETQALPYVPAAEFAKLLGLHGIKVTRPEEVGPAWDEAFAADRPVLLEFVTDPSIPPLPPHVQPEQLKKTLTALAHGDPQATQIGWKGFKGKWAEFTEHAKDKLMPTHPGA